MIRFAFGALETDPPLVRRSPIDVLVSVVAEFKIVVQGRLLLDETDFPVVELAAALKRWLSVAADERCDFEFDSMDFEEPGAVWIRKEDAGWRVGSMMQEFPDVTTYSTEQLDLACEQFVKDLEAASSAQLDLDLTPVWDLFPDDAEG